MTRAKHQFRLVWILIFLLGIWVVAQENQINTDKQKQGNFSNQGDACRRKGDIYLQTGNPEQAIKMYEEATCWFAKDGNINSQALAYESKANVCLGLSKKDEAAIAYREAMDLYEKNNEPDDQGRMAKNIGDIYYRSDNYKDALSWYDKALDCFGDENINNLRAQFDIYLAKGYIFQNMMNLARSKEMFDKAQDILTQVEEKLDGQDGRYKKWRKELEQYLIHLEKFGDWEWLGQEFLFKGHEYAGLFNTNPAPVSQKAKDSEKALEMYSKAQEYFEKISDLKGLGEVNLYKGHVFMETGRYDEALKYYNEALCFTGKTGDILTRSSVYRWKAWLYEKTGKPGNVLEQYDLLLDTYRQTKDLQGESDTLFNKAILLNKMGKKDGAVDSFEKNIKSLETFRQQTAFPELKKTFFERFYRRYEEIALFLLENKYYEKGYQYVEAMKARLFLDRLSEAEKQLQKGIDSDLKSKSDALILELSDLSRKMFEASQKKSSELEELEKVYQKKKNEFDDLLIKIRVKSPQYASVRYPEPVSLTALQKDSLKEGELLLHYFTTAEKVYVFLISKEDIQVVTLDVKRENFDNMVKNYIDIFYLDVLKKKTEREENIRRVTRLRNNHGNTIYQSIFKPLEPVIKGKKEIIIIPDGELAKIPFEALVIDNSNTNQPVYLLEKYRVKYVQSASVLASLREHGKKVTETNGFIGFGDPVYDYENFKQGKTEYKEEIDKAKDVYWPRLPGSGEEVQAIDALFRNKNQKSQYYLREKASEENAKSSCLKDFAYIHFSCHGVLGQDYQGLVLSQIPGAQGNKNNEDGYLTLNEIMNCDYNAKLVVLSACQTGLGKLEKGEGVTGLTRAFMYAGTPAVMVSLWSVDETATKKLLTRFYQDMLEKGMNKEEALRQAKLEMIKDRKYTSPYFWSAFVMYGE